MIALALFVLLCTMGMIYMFWFLSASDKAAAGKLVASETVAARLAKQESTAS